MHWRIRLSVKVKRRFKVQLLPNFNINIQRANGLLSVAELLLAMIMVRLHTVFCWKLQEKVKFELRLGNRQK